MHLFWTLLTINKKKPEASVERDTNEMLKTGPEPNHQNGKKLFVYEPHPMGHFKASKSQKERER